MDHSAGHPPETADHQRPATVVARPQQVCLWLTPKIFRRLADPAPRVAEFFDLEIENQGVRQFASFVRNPPKSYPLALDNYNDFSAQWVLFIWLILLLQAVY